MLLYPEAYRGEVLWPIARAHGVPAVPSSCRRELPVLHRRTDKIPLDAGDVEKHSDAAVAFGTRCREELHARGCHPCVRGIEVLDVKEETHPADGMLPDDGGLAFAFSLREQRPVAAPGGRLGRPASYTKTIREEFPILRALTSCCLSAAGIAF